MVEEVKQDETRTRNRWLGLTRSIAARATKIPLRSGWGVLALGALCGLIGWWMGWRELQLVFVGCVLLVVSTVPWIIGRFPIEISRSVDPRRVSIGESAIAVLTATNPTGKPVAPKRAEDKLGDLVVPIQLPLLGPGKTFEVPYPLPTDSRGAFDLGPVTMVRADPIGLFRRARAHGDVDSFWVHPTIALLATLPTGLARDLEGPSSDKSPSGGIAFHTLREYEVGDDYRHIHWRSTAKTGTLMVRHYVDNRRPHLTIVLDDRRSSYATDQDFELAVGVAASIATTGVRSGYPIAVYGPHQRYGTDNGVVTRDDLLDRFAEVTTNNTVELSVAVQEAARRNPGTTIFALVTGGLDVEELLGPMALIRSAQRTLVVRADRGSALVPAVLPGATLLDVDALDDLASAWSRIVRS